MHFGGCGSAFKQEKPTPLKELARRWNPTVFRARPGKAESHRALDDIRESIAELRHYREHFIKV